MINGTPRNNIKHWDFILKIADDYLTFLRNLVPITLFFSLSFLMITEIHFAGFSTKDIGLLLVALMTLSVGLNAMFINFATFAQKVLKALYLLQHKPLPEQLSLKQTIKGIWHESHARQLVFLMSITLMAMVIVIIYGIRYAFDFYRIISNIE